jgi:hypothetical protein
MPLIVGALLFLAQSPAVADNHAQLIPDDQKIVCKQITEAGSRIPFRVCRTAAEWEQMAKQNQDDWTSSRQSRQVGCNDVNCK